jgi:zinc protease
MRTTIGLCIIVLIASLICGSTYFAQAQQSPSRPAQARSGAPFLQQVKVYEETPYVTKVVLKNGMTVLVDEYRIHPVVSLQVYVHAGYFNDAPQSLGMAGLVAAIVQRGAPDKSGGSYRQQVQALGGAVRSVTDYRTTLFEVIAPSNQWKRALAVQAEGILNPSFEADKVGLEARLLQNEAKGILDDPEVSGSEKMLALAFNQGRLGKWNTIRRGELGKISPESVAAFYKAQYVPDNMTLVVSGDINSGEVLNEVVRLYTKPAGLPTKASVVSLAEYQSDFRFDSVRANVSTPHLFFGFRVVPENNDDFRTLEVLSAIIGMGESSVLSMQVRDQKKLIAGADTKLISYPEFGYLSVHAKVKAANLDRSEIAILTELELLKREEPTEVDIERALALLERSYWKRLETVTGRAETLAHFEYLGDWKRTDRQISELRKVKPADVKRVAAKYLRLQNCTLIEYLPANGEERLLTEEVARRTFSALITPSTDQEQEERNKQTVLGVNLSPRPGAFKFSEIRHPFQTASILRGPDLFIHEEHSSPVIDMGLFFPGGKLDEKREEGGITRLMTGLMLRGGSDIRQFYRQLEVYGGTVEPIVADDYFGLYLSVLSHNFEAAFRLLLETIRAPAFDKDEVARQKDLLLGEILSHRNSSLYARDLLNQALFEEFSYSIPPQGLETGISSITPEALKLWYEMHVKNRKPVAALIGDTKGTSLASVFVKNFSGSRIQDVKIREDFAKSLEKGKSIDQKWNGSESLILVGFQAPPEDDEDGNAAAILEGYTGQLGRFSRELRDSLGVAHYASVVYNPRLRGGSLILQVATSPGNEEEVLTTLREEIQRVRTGPIPFRDFRAAVSEAVGAYELRQQSRTLQIADIAENVIAGKGLEGFQNYTAALQDVREEDLLAVAQRILNLGKAVIVIMRGTQ